MKVIVLSLVYMGLCAFNLVWGAMLAAKWGSPVIGVFEVIAGAVIVPAIVDLKMWRLK